MKPLIYHLAKSINKLQVPTPRQLARQHPGLVEENVALQATIADLQRQLTAARMAVVGEALDPTASDKSLGEAYKSKRRASLEFYGVGWRVCSFSASFG